MTKLKAVTRIARAPEAPESVPNDALILIEIGNNVYRLTLSQLAAAAGEAGPTPGTLYMADGVTSCATPVEYADDKFQFVLSDRRVCQSGAPTMTIYNNSKITSLSVPAEPFSTTGDGYANAVAIGTPVHGIVVNGQTFTPAGGGTVTMIVTNNIVSCGYTP